MFLSICDVLREKGEIKLHYVIPTLDEMLCTKNSVTLKRSFLVFVLILLFFAVFEIGFHESHVGLKLNL